MITEYGHLGQLMEINGNEAVVDVWNYGVEGDTEYSDIRKCSVFESNNMAEIEKLNTMEAKRDFALSVCQTPFPDLSIPGPIMQRIENEVKDVLENMDKIKYVYSSELNEETSTDPSLYFSFNDIKKIVINNIKEEDVDLFSKRFDEFLSDQKDPSNNLSSLLVFIGDDVYVNWLIFLNFICKLYDSTNPYPIVKYIRETVGMREQYLNRKYFRRVVV